MVRVHPEEIEDLQANIQRLPEPILSSFKSTSYLNALYDEFNKQYNEFISNRTNIRDKNNYIIKWNNDDYVINRHILYYGTLGGGNVYTYVIHLKTHIRHPLLLLTMDTYKPGIIVATFRYFSYDNSFLLEFYSYDEITSNIEQAKFENKWVYDELLLLSFLVKWNNKLDVFPPNNSTLRIKFNQLKGNELTPDSSIFDRQLIYETKYEKENINFKNYFKKILINNENLTNKISLDKPSSRSGCKERSCAIMGGSKRKARKAK
jgi:hypothetical protein